MQLKERQFSGERQLGEACSSHVPGHHHSPGETSGRHAEGRDG